MINSKLSSQNPVSTKSVAKRKAMSRVEGVSINPIFVAVLTLH